MERNGLQQISLSKERNNRTRAGLAKPQPKVIASTTKHHITLILKGTFFRKLNLTLMKEFSFRLKAPVEQVYLNTVSDELITAKISMQKNYKANISEREED